MFTADIRAGTEAQMQKSIISPMLYNTTMQRPSSFFIFSKLMTIITEQSMESKNIANHLNQCPLIQVIFLKFKTALNR